MKGVSVEVVEGRGVELDATEGLVAMTPQRTQALEGGTVGDECTLAGFVESNGLVEPSPERVEVLHGTQTTGVATDATAEVDVPRGFVRRLPLALAADLHVEALGGLAHQRLHDDLAGFGQQEGRLQAPVLERK